MRDELHRMERADRYLDGAMSPEERSAFEVALTSDAGLRQEVDDMRALREGMHRLHLRGAVTAAHNGWLLKKWLPKLFTFTMVAGAIVGGGLYLKQHPEIITHELDKLVPVDTIIHSDTIRVEHRSPVRIMRRDTVVDTVIYLLKDGKRIRVDSIPKGARVIGTERSKKAEAPTDSTERLNALPDPPFPGNEAVAALTNGPAPNDASSSAQSDGLNYLTSSKPPTHLGQATEMQILRPKNAESQPEYPGGFDAMYRFLKQNLRVPNDLKLAGTVVVSFVVDERGAIKEPTVEQPLSRSCDAEALRVVKSMPKWIPCKEGGKPVRSRIEVPLTFSPVEAKQPSSNGELIHEDKPIRMPNQLRNGGG